MALMSRMAIGCDQATRLPSAKSPFSGDGGSSARSNSLASMPAPPTSAMASRAVSVMKSIAGANKPLPAPLPMLAPRARGGGSGLAPGAGSYRRWVTVIMAVPSARQWCTRVISALPPATSSTT